jgi:hypothetical protein
MNLWKTRTKIKKTTPISINMSSAWKRKIQSTIYLHPLFCFVNWHSEAFLWKQYLNNLQCRSPLRRSYMPYQIYNLTFISCMIIIFPWIKFPLLPAITSLARQTTWGSVIKFFIKKNLDRKWNSSSACWLFVLLLGFVLLKMLLTIL